jgi:hypothetical protein
MLTAPVKVLVLSIVEIGSVAIHTVALPRRNEITRAGAAPAHSWVRGKLLGGTNEILLRYS